MSDAKKMMKVLKGIYKNKPSIFVKNVEEVLNDTMNVNRYDEYILKQIGIGYLMMALDCHTEIKEKMTEEDIDNLIYSIGCNMADFPILDAIEESTKYNLDI